MLYSRHIGLPDGSRGRSVEHVFETRADDAQAELSGVELLRRAVQRLLSETPVELPGSVALERLRALTTGIEQLQAARLAAVRDVDARELFALDGAGSTRGWLRAQLGGDDGQLALARRLGSRPSVEAAHAAAALSTRAASQVCAALDKVPAEVDEGQLLGVLRDGVPDVLRQQSGALAPDDAAALAQRTADAALLETCCAATTRTPAQRLEPAFVLLAERLPAGLLGWALRCLVDPLLPDGTEDDPADPYYLELRPLLDGDVDVRGHLDAETGQCLAAEIERRLRAARAAEEAAAAEDAAGRAGTIGAADPAPAMGGVAGGVDDVEGSDDVDGSGGVGGSDLDAWDAALDASTAPVGGRTRSAAGDATDRPVSTPRRLVTAGRRRFDALRALLRDLGEVVPGSGQARPVSLTITASVEAVEGRLGALPGLLTTSGLPVPLSTATLQRMGCHSELNVVLLDALGKPVGASGTHRSATRRERRALRAQWGPTCAVRGCRSTLTVPHHVVPWWSSRQTRLRDLAPLCEHCHHDLHEGRRTLRLRDGRLVDDHGWATEPVPLAASAAA